MIFKKQAIQGGAVLSNGQRIDFSPAGYYETENEDEISQLSVMYQVVEAEEKPVEKKQEAPGASAVKVGMASSSALKAIAK